VGAWRCSPPPRWIQAPVCPPCALRTWHEEGEQWAVKRTPQAWCRYQASCWRVRRNPALGISISRKKRGLEENMRFAEDLGAEPIRVQGSDVARALMEVAHDKNVGSIVIGHSRHGRLHELLRLARSTSTSSRIESAIVGHPR
jgi:K+-sensing histidine kinase KdpD